MDYVKELLTAINNYTETDMQSKMHLRDLICVISDNTDLTKDALMQELLYVASRKMRMFGYNVQNNLTSEPLKHKTEGISIKDETISQLYRSKVWPNNLLDRSQKEVIDAFQQLSTKRLLVSASTSYGKTYLMREIFYLNNERYNTIMLIFPTIALLRENAFDMQNFVLQKELSYNIINSVTEEIDLEQRNIFIFTPERALQLMALYPDIKIDFFFFDEMYKEDEDFANCPTKEDEDIVSSPDERGIEKSVAFLDEARAKTFRIALYLLAKTVPEYYLAGPNLSKDNFSTGMKRFIASNKIHIVEILFEPTIRLVIPAWKAKIQETSELLPPRKITALNVRDNSGTKQSIGIHQRIERVIQYVHGNQYGKTMLYCTNPSKTVQYANSFAKNRDGNIAQSGRFSKFLKHLKRAYDFDGSIEHWGLYNILQKNIAIHHGRLPRYIQSEILRQFNHGSIDILFCTSTIVEGVNTEAQNMVLINSSKGTEQLTQFDIKNICGRAGRYYHNFIGRVFLLDRMQAKILNSSENQLDFAIYGDKIISSIDLDNAESVDLCEKNKAFQAERRSLQSAYLLPQRVFLKNRLIPMETQEQLAQCLHQNKDLLDEFDPLLASKISVRNTFLNGYYIDKLLKAFVEAGIISSQTHSYFVGVAYSYQKNGLAGLIRYQLKKPNTSVDKAYLKAFKVQKDVLEHKIPQLISLFDSIYTFVAGLHGKDCEDFSLSSVSRFYETGTKSPLGEYLVEFGFPTDTIRKIEREVPKLINVPKSEVRQFCREHRGQIKGYLDDYEWDIFVAAMQSLPT